MLWFWHCALDLGTGTPLPEHLISAVSHLWKNLGWCEVGGSEEELVQVCLEMYLVLISQIPGNPLRHSVSSVAFENFNQELEQQHGW